MRTGRPDLIRDMNRSLVLNLVRERGPMSRADVSRLSGLSPSTVTAITGQLLADRYLLEGGAASEHLRPAGVLGRPAVLLSVNPAAGIVVGIKVAAEAVTLALADLAGQTLALRELEHSGRSSVAQTVEFLASAVADFDSAISADSPLLGIGLGVPGIVDPATRRVTASPFLGWGEDDIATSLEARLGVPVHIDNDVNTLTIAEHLFGAGRGCRNFSVVTVGRGVGMGAVVDDQLHRGSTGGAGELGHVSIAAAEPRKCWCGRTGCLETIASEPAMVRDVREATGRLVTPRELAQAAQIDPAVAAVLRRAGAEVGRAIGNVVLTMDPELVVVAGEGVRLGPEFLGPIQLGIARAAHPDDKEVEVVIEPWGDEAWARGAASLVLRELFHPAHLRTDLARSPEPVAASSGRR